MISNHSSNMLNNRGEVEARNMNGALITHVTDINKKDIANIVKE